MHAGLSTVTVYNMIVPLTWSILHIKKIFGYEIYGETTTEEKHTLTAALEPSMN